MYKIELISVHKSLIKMYSFFLIGLLKKSINSSFKTCSQPVKEKKLTILKSPHVNKKSKEQFIVHCYKKIIFCDSKTVDTYLKFFVINKPSSLSVRIRLLGKG